MMFEPKENNFWDISRNRALSRSGPGYWESNGNSIERMFFSYITYVQQYVVVFGPLQASSLSLLEESLLPQSVSSLEICKFASEWGKNWWCRQEEKQITQVICPHLACRFHFQWFKIILYRKDTKEPYLQWKAPFYKSKFPASTLETGGDQANIKRAARRVPERSKLKSTEEDIYLEKKVENPHS